MDVLEYSFQIDKANFLCLQFPNMKLLFEAGVKDFQLYTIFAAAQISYSFILNLMQLWYNGNYIISKTQQRWFMVNRAKPLVIVLYYLNDKIISALCM